MRSCLVLSVIVALISFVVAQQRGNDPAEWITPLKTQRSEVEQKAREVKRNSGFTTYETENGFIKVRYAVMECEWHGWGVGPETVISYERTPKSEMKFDIMDFPPNQFVRSVEHTNEYYTHKDKGIQYVVAAQPEKVITSIRYGPTRNYSNLRCTGFPPYDLASEVYIPLETYGLTSDPDLDVGQLGGFFITLKKNPHAQGSVFIYAGNGERQKAASLKRMIERYAYEIENVPKKRLTIALGGCRDKTEIEAFMTAIDSPSPIARPRYIASACGT